MPYENPGDIPGVVAAEAAGDEAQVGSHDDLYKTDAAFEIIKFKILQTNLNCLFRFIEKII